MGTRCGELLTTYNNVCDLFNQWHFNNLREKLWAREISHISTITKKTKDGNNEVSITNDQKHLTAIKSGLDSSL